MGSFLGGFVVFAVLSPSYRIDFPLIVLRKFQLYAPRFVKELGFRFGEEYNPAAANNGNKMVCFRFYVHGVLVGKLILTCVPRQHLL